MLFGGLMLMMVSLELYQIHFGGFFKSFLETPG